MEGVGREPEIVKPALQPGIELSPESPARPVAATAAAAVAAHGLASPDVQSQRSSFDTPRSRDARSPAPGARGGDGSGDEPRDVIVRSFAPRVSIYTSPDTDELIRLKGLYGGLCALLRPFGEAVPGNVIIRDSMGASKSWSDFGISFTEFDQSNGYIPNPRRASGTASIVSQSQTFEGGEAARTLATDEAKKRAEQLNEVVQNSIQNLARQPQQQHAEDNASGAPLFSHFLRRLMADREMVPHEAFTHPVACVIVVTSQNSTPIDTLRDLYNDTRQESDNTPPWAGNDFLRYYVLIHDDDHDDISKSTALFNQMKRHFGLHTHLLRLRGEQCTRDHADALPLPACSWLSPEEELAELRQKGDLLQFDEFQQYVFESDAAAIRTFVRELVTQSVIPFMESRTATWNDQVASRRRGISGRFMSLSKRWTGFGAGRNKNSESASSKSNYNASIGGYAADSNEWHMHHLADYALMLRDFKLSASTYDMLRSDFGDDKAWHHHAVANEMMAISLLLGSHTPRSLKIETIEQLIDTSTYSYITRCGDPFGALRCLIVMIELFRSRGGAAVEEAAKWGYRLLELTILTPLMQNILADRLALSFEAQAGTGIERYGSRKRKVALWHLLGAGAWLVSSDDASNAALRLGRAQQIYSSLGAADNAPPAFTGMQNYLDTLQEKIARAKRADLNELSGLLLLDARNEQASAMDEETKAFDHDTSMTTLTTTTTSAPLRTKRYSIHHPVPPSPGAGLLQQLSEAQEADGFA